MICGITFKKLVFNWPSKLITSSKSKWSMVFFELLKFTGNSIAYIFLLFSLGTTRIFLFLGCDYFYEKRLYVLLNTIYACFII
jgi:hypothetical protein